MVRRIARCSGSPDCQRTEALILVAAFVFLLLVRTMRRQVVQGFWSSLSPVNVCLLIVKLIFIGPI